MRHAWVIVASLVLAAPARAEDTVFKVGDGYELVAGPTSIDVRKGKRRAVVFPSFAFDVKATTDAKARTVKIERAYECRAQVEDTMTLDALEARLLNTEALVLHRKKTWAKAAVGFEKAAKLDPSWRLPAFNLASAQAQLGALPAATAALAPWLAAEPVATYARVAVDPELQPLLATPELLAVKGTTKPGTAKMAENGIEGDIAYSAERGWIAFVHGDAGYLDCNSSLVVSIVAIKTGAEVAYLPIGSVPVGRGMCESGATKAAREKAKIARVAKVKVASQFLIDFGFAPTASESESAETKADDSDKQFVRFAKARIGVVTNNGTVNVLRGNTSLGTGVIGGGRFSRATYLPDAHAMMITTYIPSDLCARTDEYVIAVTEPVPAKK